MTKDEMLIRMSTPQGFADLFRELLQQGETNKETFDRMNEIWEERHGQPRYAEYKSFQSACSKRKNRKP